MDKITTAEETLRRNTVEYKQHLTTKNRLSRALKFQENIRAFQSIPKRYYPSTTPEIIYPNTELGQKFEAEYRKLFFHHLEEVIMHNTISLELEQARLKEIVQRTERQLSTLKAPTEDINKLCQQFYTQNNIHDEGASSNIPKTEAKRKTTPKLPKNENKVPNQTHQRQRRASLIFCPEATTTHQRADTAQPQHTHIDTSSRLPITRQRTHIFTNSPPPAHRITTHNTTKFR